jgi:hypothetical protein
MLNRAGSLEVRHCLGFSGLNVYTVICASVVPSFLLLPVQADKLFQLQG